MEYVLWLIISTLYRVASHAWVCTQIFITSYPHNTHSELEYNYISEKGTETCTSDLLVNVFTYTLCYFLPGKETLTTYYIVIFSEYIYGWIGSVFVLHHRHKQAEIVYKYAFVIMYRFTQQKNDIGFDWHVWKDWMSRKENQGSENEKTLSFLPWSKAAFSYLLFIYASIFRPLQYKLVQKGFNISGSR